MYVALYCSYYSGENAAAIESTQTRRQIQVPTSTLLTTSMVGPGQQPYPVNSNYQTSTHAEHTDRPTPAIATAPELIVAYDDKPSTWPRKQRLGQRHYPLTVDDDNDPARLQQDTHNDRDRLGRQHDCKSAETIFTTTETQQHYDAASSSAAAAAAEILGASVTVPRTTDPNIPYSNQYSVNPPPTTSSPSIPHPIHPKPGSSPYPYPRYPPSPYNNTGGQRSRTVEDAPGLSPNPYPGYPPSPYNDTGGHRSRTVEDAPGSSPNPYPGYPPSPYNDTQGQRSRTVEDGRHAVDLLFDNLYGSSPQFEGLSSTATAMRTVPESPYVPTHSPHVKEFNYLSDEPRSQTHAADLLTKDHRSPSAVNVHSYYR